MEEGRKEGGYFLKAGVELPLVPSTPSTREHELNHTTGLSGKSPLSTCTGPGDQVCRHKQTAQWLCGMAEPQEPWLGS